MTKACSCGTPSLATYYVHTVVGTDDTTELLDAYVCAAHLETEDEMATRYESEGFTVLEGPTIEWLR